MPEKYIPKFKTGYTVETKDLNDLYVIVGTNEQIADYSSIYAHQESYNDSDEYHTLYYAYSPRFANTSWIWEDSFEKAPYCVNENRGRQILKQRESFIITHLEIHGGENMEKFEKRFLNPISPSENDTVPIQTEMSQAIPPLQMVSERINVISEIPPEEEDWDDFYYDSEELL